MLSIAIDTKDWTLINETIVVLCKRRAQFKQVIQGVVDAGVAQVDKTPSEPKRLELMETLRTVSAGKIFVEVQRARLTRLLAAAKEKEGKIGEATDIILEVQVETYGSMEQREKVDFLLEQLRMTLARKDLVRAQIISKKVLPKTLLKEEFQDLKLRYHHLLIQMNSEEHKYLEICRSWLHIYDTPSTQADQAAWTDALQNTIIYLLLSPYGNDVSDLLNRIGADRKTESLPVLKAAIDKFLTQELIDWKALQLSLAAPLGKHVVFSGKDKAARWKDLHKRVIEHNIRIIAKNYSRITTKRLGELLALSSDETEQYLSEQVQKANIYARMDRPAGLVSFIKRQDPNDVLNEWRGNVNKLLDLVESTTHLINRENMVYKIK